MVLGGSWLGGGLHWERVGKGRRKKNGRGGRAGALCEGEAWREGGDAGCLTHSGTEQRLLLHEEGRESSLHIQEGAHARIQGPLDPAEGPWCTAPKGCLAGHLNGLQARVARAEQGPWLTATGAGATRDVLCTPQPVSRGWTGGAPAAHAPAWRSPVAALAVGQPPAGRGAGGGLSQLLAAPFEVRSPEPVPITTCCLPAGQRLYTSTWRQSGIHKKQSAVPWRHSFAVHASAAKPMPPAAPYDSP